MRNSRIKRANIPAQNTRLPLIGKVRIGEKRKNASGKEYPVSLDYFKATGSYAAKFEEVYDKPDRIQIVFISDDDFQSCYEEWDGRDKEGRRAGYGDGETYYLWEYGKESYRAVTDRDEVAKFSKEHNVKWKQVLTINFVLPAIKGVFGVWQLQTGGDKSSINAIRNTFDEIKEQAGTIVNIPFDLCVKKVTSDKPEMKSVYPVITLVPNLSAENMEQLRTFFEAGLDVKRQGILNERKLAALGHSTEDENATKIVEGVNANEVPKRNNSGISDICDKCGSVEIEGVCTECKPLGDDSVPLYSESEQSIARKIKQCKTEQALRELYGTEPALCFDESKLLSSLWEDRLIELKAPSDGETA